MDKRLVEYPWVFFGGALCCAAFSATCVYLLVDGALTGVVFDAPARRRGMRGIFHGQADDPTGYAMHMLAWAMLALGFAFWTRILWWYYQGSGGLFGTPDQKIWRRIAYFRRSIDAGVFMWLANHVPGHWRTARLELEWQVRQGQTRLRHSISNLEGQTDPVPLPEGFYRTTENLLDLFQKFGKTFRRAVYAMERVPSGRWKTTLTTE